MAGPISKLSLKCCSEVPTAITRKPSPPGECAIRVNSPTPSVPSCCHATHAPRRWRRVATRSSPQLQADAPVRRTCRLPNRLDQRPDHQAMQRTKAGGTPSLDKTRQARHGWSCAAEHLLRIAKPDLVSMCTKLNVRQWCCVAQRRHRQRTTTSCRDRPSRLDTYNHLSSSRPPSPFNTHSSLTLPSSTLP